MTCWPPPVLAKISSLRPSRDNVRLETTLKLAQLGLALGKNSPLRPHFHLAAGMAEFRKGQYRKANETLSDASLLTTEHHDKVDATGFSFRQIVDASAFYRAMCLFKLGKKAESERLLNATMSKMSSLPPDENSLPADVDCNTLITWMACREAQRMIKGEINAPKSPR